MNMIKASKSTGAATAATVKKTDGVSSSQNIFMKALSHRNAMKRQEGSVLEESGAVVPSKSKKNSLIEATR